ncbi:CPBP family intramembrane metalloprotease [Gordonia sp. ABSL1-1]|uniref:CPBP family intramembrane glutamic endopeptidase n=1 Tax=Gordonia sp. ABSL1-1 TaxID=3053923 RepID=UPI002573A969|nr:CPBP family intramembrane glutamic endopeptidase [Gordonia sp. ABSL1-1]MDL9937623.1 CPBP family intramembrane metalloprotease [Gordonia sp. ABSL1-1]
MGFSPREVLNPPDPPDIAVITDPSQRRALWLELGIVGVLTFGFSAIYAILSLIESELTGGIEGTTVALNPSRSSVEAIDALRQLLSGIRLFAMAGLGVYLLWRSGVGRDRVGLGRWSPRRDIPAGLALTAIIGIPGLAVVATARALGLNASLVPSTADAWWEWPVLILVAIGNGAAEEILVVAYFITRLRQLGFGANSALGASAVLRGSYHLYQGFGAGVGNLAMGLVFGRFFQVSGRTWPLVIAHGAIDVIAFVGYALLRDHLPWVG